MLRVAAARACRCQSSGTYTNRPAAATSSPAISIATRGSPFGSASTVLSRNVKVQSVRAFSFAGRAEISLASPRATFNPSLSAMAATASRRASSSVSDAPGRPSGSVWRTRAHVSGRRHEDQPLLGAVGDVAFESGDTHAPSRRRQVHAEQLPSARFARRFSDELVRIRPTFIRHRHEPPAAVER